MQRNEQAQAPIETITGILQSQGMPCEVFPSVFTHPIEYFRLQCLDRALGDDSFKKAEDVVKDAKLYAAFVLGASGGLTPKTKPYIVGERVEEAQRSFPPGEIEPLTPPVIPHAEQRLHTMQKLFDEIDPNPDSMCNLEAIHHGMTIRLLKASQKLKGAQEEVAALQEEIDNLALDIIQHSNTDFLLKERKPFSTCTPIPDPIRLSKRQRLWARKAEEVAVS